MARINLLPWRDELREERKKQFTSMIVLSAIVGAVVWYAGHTYIGQQIDSQKARNGFLKVEIKKLDEQIKKIKELESTKANLLARMDVIQQLQQGRPQIVHLFEEISNAVPDGVYLTSVRQEAEKLTVKGQALSQARVSAFSRRLESSEWLKNAVPDEINSAQSGSNRISYLTLRVEQRDPADKENDGGAS